MIKYIKQVDNNDELYCNIWHQRIITDPSKDYQILKTKVQNKTDQILRLKLS